jgi:pre-mRNA-processing factor 40
MPALPPPIGYPPYGLPPPAMIPPGPPPGRPPFALPSMGGALPPPVLPAEDPNNWTEHTAGDGRKYYHNKVTKVSTYDRPACLDKDQQQAANAGESGAGGAAKPPGPPALPPCRWKEYKTAEGKTYYSDGSKSLWTEPEELKCVGGWTDGRRDGGACICWGSNDSTGLCT